MGVCVRARIYTLLCDYYIILYAVAVGACVRVWVRVCVSACIHVRDCERTCVRVCGRMCACGCVYVHARVRLPVRRRMCHVCHCTWARMRLRALVRAALRACVY